LALSTLGGSPGRCFLNSSTSAPSSVLVFSASAVDRVADVEAVVEEGEDLLVGLVAIARSRTVTGSLRLRSMRTKTLPFLSISSSSTSRGPA